ncbi:type IV pilus assembly protein PilM [Candidatus Gottesmanbacteria bacterium]|nr:type IV pilus assembly protein PilM [Candidatus Gottesmanbacteria bacterium]
MHKVLLGLDIGTNSIKAVQIAREKSGKHLLAAGYIATSAKALASLTTGDEQELASTINRLVHDMKISTEDVSASLPSSKVITRVIEVPMMKDEELTSSIQWEAEQYIPLPLSSVKLDYAVIGNNTENTKMKILLVAAPITIIEKYMRVITLAGLNPVALETEILASSRCIVESYQTLENVLILSFGATSSEIALTYNRTLIYARSLPIGGNTLTKAITEELGFEIAQAEEYKKTYGLEEDKLEGKVYKTLEPFFKSVLTEIEKTLAYFKEQYPKDEIKSVIACGGGAKLPGLVLAITKNFGIDSQLCNPFLNLSVDPNILPILTPDMSMYTVAVGLGLKED